VAPLVGAIAREAEALRRRGADVVIVTAHAGGRCTSFERPDDLSSCEPGGEILAVARDLPPSLVDVIVGGHSHAGVAHQVEGIAIIESFNGGRSFGRVDLTVDRAARRVVKRQIFPPERLGPLPATYEDRPVAADPAIDAILAPEIARVAEMKARPLGVVLETPIGLGSGTESPLGNLFTEALLQAVPRADISINNTFGGLRADLPKGPLTFGRLFETFPFDNLVVSFKLTGAGLERVFAERLRQDRSLPGIAGLRVRATCHTGTLGVELVRRAGRTVADDEIVTVATTDFLASGGDGIFVPVTPPQGLAIDDTGQLLRDAVEEWLGRRGGRLRAADLIDVGTPRWQLPGPIPLVCKS
jgi:5'-nucleotidase